MTPAQFDQFVELHAQGQQYLVQAVSLGIGLLSGLLVGLLFFVIWRGVGD